MLLLHPHWLVSVRTELSAELQENLKRSLAWCHVKDELKTCVDSYPRLLRMVIIFSRAIKSETDFCKLSVPE